MGQPELKRRAVSIREQGEPLLPHGGAFRLVPQVYGPSGRAFRELFDAALDLVHYAGSCQRVGRCMRLAIMEGPTWLGGIVLGSTFPNIGCRDEELGLKRYCRGEHLVGLRSPWARENRAYWSALQGVVNHARTFVFPEFQGAGVGIRAHERLLDQGIGHWRRRYPGPVTALDTLCDAQDSALFRRNGWSYVGQTKGYGSDPSRTLVEHSDDQGLRNNVALRPTGRPWEVWVRGLGPGLHVDSPVS